MEPVIKHSGSSRGLEILFFEDAELQKCKKGQASFAASGPLSVLYFKDFNRFFLRLNDWLYPLMRRLPLLGMDKSDGSSSRSYSLPGPNGFCYILRINSYGSQAGLENFESILQDCSKFSWKGDVHHGHLEASPDDKLQRHLKKETGMMQVIGENLKQGLHVIKNKIETVKTGTKNLTSRKKALDLKSIKNKNFRKNAKSSFKKDFFQAGEKLSQEFLKLRQSNLNMTMGKSYNELLKTSDTQAPSFWLPKEHLEDTILNFRDISNKGNFTWSDVPVQKQAPIKQGRENIAEDRSRGRNLGQTQQSNIGQIPAHEGMTHYQG